MQFWKTENAQFFGKIAALALLSLNSKAAFAGEWGALVGLNNPAGSRLGLNFLYQSTSSWGFEFGVGGLAASSTDSGRSAATWGDFDFKWFASPGAWRGYLEGGMAFGLGAGSGGTGFAAGSPFIGGGLLYSGSRMLFHISGDYKLNERVAYPALGIGFKF
ncbi:hypothetical protein EBU99_04765 [bacterium]|nr:hypothetical protein [bacterium]